MKKPFFYFEIVSHASRGDVSRTAYDVIVRCANLGYGQNRDPIIVKVTEMDSVEEGIEEAYEVMDEGSQILTSEEYMREMVRVLEERER